MAYDLVGNTDSLDVLIKALEEEITFVDEFIGELYARVVAASSFWEGDSYVAFAQLLGSYSNYFYNYLELIQTYYNTLTSSTMAATDSLEKSVKSAIEF